MEGINNKCFVCKKEILPEGRELNIYVNLSVCSSCKGSEKEKQAEGEYLDELADGLVCGCI